MTAKTIIIVTMMSAMRFSEKAVTLQIGRRYRGQRRERHSSQMSAVKIMTAPRIKLCRLKSDMPVIQPSLRDLGKSRMRSRR